VSGGSYLAAAWTTARKTVPDAWSRLSAEENHLRRHSSYLAPGLGGKLWALARFLFGFIVNVGLITLFLGVVALPAGWLIDAAESDRPAASGGKVDLPAGGCVQLADGRLVTVVAGAALRSGEGALRLDPSAKADPPAADRVDTPPATCPSTAEEAKDTNALRAAASGRRLAAGSRVRLRLDAPLRVSPSTVVGCVGSATCARSDADVIAVTSGARLMSAPEAFVTLAGGAVVGEDGVTSKSCGASACQRYGSPPWLDLAMAVLLGFTLFLGVGHVVARATPAMNKRAVWATKLLCGASLTAGFAFYVFPYLVTWAENGRTWVQDRELQTGGASTVIVLAALSAQLAPFLSSSENAPAGKTMGLLKRIGGRLRPLLVRFAGAVVGPLIVLSIAVAFASYGAQEAAGALRPGLVGLWLALLGPLMLLLAGGDLNEWSLHPFYRDRLRSAFAVDPRSNPAADPREDPLPELPTSGPQLLVCAALNLADDRVTAPGRAVAPWTFARDSFGSSVLKTLPRPLDDPGVPSHGYIDPAVLPADLKHLAWTWTAVAVSGAAFSPAMGKMNRPERFLLALGNLRLGVWYPNPRWFAVEPEWYRRHHPRPWYLAKEALGLLRGGDRWLYVTDGGHYENLGLVELLRLGCREIYCFDAAGDPPNTFGTLADAMRIAREEMDVEVTIDPAPLMPDKGGKSKVGVQAGIVRWGDSGGGTPAVGWLVLAKLSVPKTAPFDVIDLARTLDRFPSHPTADQLYTDQKFEAYRALGSHLGDKAGALGRRIRQLVANGSSVAEAVALANAEVNGLDDEAEDGSERS
jgi:hypothetical protein